MSKTKQTVKFSKLAQLAGKCAFHFDHLKRDDDKTIIILKDTAPKWLRDLVYEIHGDFMPDDYKYRWIYEALSDLMDCSSNDTEGDEIISEYIPQWCEGFIYNSERTAWLASNLRRADYIDDAISEGLYDFKSDFSTFDLLNLGVIREQEEIYIAVTQALCAKLKGVQS